VTVTKTRLKGSPIGISKFAGRDKIRECQELGREALKDHPATAAERNAKKHVDLVDVFAGTEAVKSVDEFRQQGDAVQDEQNVQNGIHPDPFWRQAP
jgi:hypothetical protein